MKPIKLRPVEDCVHAVCPIHDGACTRCRRSIPRRMFVSESSEPETASETPPLYTGYRSSLHSVRRALRHAGHDQVGVAEASAFPGIVVFVGPGADKAVADTVAFCPAGVTFLTLDDLLTLSVAYAIKQRTLGNLLRDVWRRLVPCRTT